MKHLIAIFLASTAFAGTFAILPTGSMHPAISAKGALVSYEPCAFAQVKAGDIILFKRPGFSHGFAFSVVCHRVVKVVKFASGDTALVTKGDNNSSKYPGYVCAEDFVGVVTSIRNN